MGSWFATEQALPDEDEAIRFIVGQRDVPLHGCSAKARLPRAGGVTDRASCAIGAPSTTTDPASR